MARESSTPIKALYNWVVCRWAVSYKAPKAHKGLIRERYMSQPPLNYSLELVTSGPPELKLPDPPFHHLLSKLGREKTQGGILQVCPTQYQAVSRGAMDNKKCTEEGAGMYESCVQGVLIIPSAPLRSLQLGG